MMTIDMNQSLAFQFPFLSTLNIKNKITNEEETEKIQIKRLHYSILNTQYSIHLNLNFYTYVSSLHSNAIVLTSV